MFGREASRCDGKQDRTPILMKSKTRLLSAHESFMKFGLPLQASSREPLHATRATSAAAARAAMPKERERRAAKR
jgi:hypothetical protein